MDALPRISNLHTLAIRSLRCTQVSSNEPVFAPARTTLISGIDASSSGTDHMRSKVQSPSVTAG